MQDLTDAQNQTYMYAAIDLLKQKGFDNIRADFSDYERPAKLITTGSEKEYMPDITAKTQNGKCYFEIVSDTHADKALLKDKWSLFSALAQHKKGTFFLLVPRGKMRFTNDILNKSNINADILKIS